MKTGRCSGGSLPLPRFPDNLNRSGGAIPALQSTSSKEARFSRLDSRSDVCFEEHSFISNRDVSIRNRLRLVCWVILSLPAALLRGIAGSDVNYRARRFDPSIIVREAGVGFDGQDDLICGYGLFGSAFDDSVEDDPQVFAPARKKAHGFDVAMKSAVVDFIAPGDVRRGEPIAVFLLDVLAVRMTADGAFSGVTLDVRLKLFVFNERVFGGGD